jgi:hypothetical protein
LCDIYMHHATNMTKDSLLSNDPIITCLWAVEFGGSHLACNRGME